MGLFSEFRAISATVRLLFFESASQASNKSDGGGGRVGPNAQIVLRGSAKGKSAKTVRSELLASGITQGRARQLMTQYCTAPVAGKAPRGDASKDEDSTMVPRKRPRWKDVLFKGPTDGNLASECAAADLGKSGSVNDGALRQFIFGEGVVDLEDPAIDDLPSVGVHEAPLSFVWVGRAAVPGDGLCLYHSLLATVDVEAWLASIATEALKNETHGRKARAAKALRTNYHAYLESIGRLEQLERLRLPGAAGYHGVGCSIELMQGLAPHCILATSGDGPVFVSHITQWIGSEWALGTRPMLQGTRLECDIAFSLE